MQFHDLSYFLSNIFWLWLFSEYTLDTYEFKKEKNTDYILIWKSNGVYTSKHKPLYTAFLHSIKISGYRMRIKFDKDPLTVEQNNYTTKILNAYIVCNLDACQKNPLNNSKLKKCLLGATIIVQNSDKENWLYSGNWIAFDRAGSRNFGNYFAWNVVIFGVDKSSLTNTDNRENDLLVRDEGPNYGINGSFGSPEEKCNVNFSTAKTKFCGDFCLNFGCYITIALRVICFVIGKKYLSLKPIIIMLPVLIFSRNHI